MLPKAVMDHLAPYTAATPGTRAGLARLMMQGKTAGTGRLVILAVDQGFEHGPLRSFGMEPAGHDPAHHFKLAIEGQVSALAAPLGFLEAMPLEYTGLIPTILKVNSSNSLAKPDQPQQAVTATIKDALRLGCTGIGYTIYPGSNQSFDMFEKLRDLTREAHEAGLVVVVWSYPRGNMSKAGETALDVASYGAHLACLLGADIVKCKIPTAHMETPEGAKGADQMGLNKASLQDRIQYMVQACFGGNRLVIFSGGDAKDTPALLDEIKGIRDGGGHGSIIGRNIFQRPLPEALKLIQDIQHIYASKG